MNEDLRGKEAAEWIADQVRGEEVPLADAILALRSCTDNHIASPYVLYGWLKVVGCVDKTALSGCYAEEANMEASEILKELEKLFTEDEWDEAAYGV